MIGGIIIALVVFATIYFAALFRKDSPYYELDLAEQSQANKPTNIKF